MTEEQTSYRQIMKATSLFGGVQVFSIIITIIRTKFIAVLLGPLGMGIAGLLTTTTTFIGGLTNRKYTNISKTSRETAKRELGDLETKGIIKKNPGRGRSTSYSLNRVFLK